MVVKCTFHFFTHLTLFLWERLILLAFTTFFILANYVQFNLGGVI